MFFLQDEVSINEATDDSYSMAKEGDDNLDISKFNTNLANNEAPKSEPKKIRLILKGKPQVVFKVPRDTKRQKLCLSHRKFQRQALHKNETRSRPGTIAKQEKHSESPTSSGTKEFLYHVEARDVIKHEDQWLYNLQQIKNTQAKKEGSPKKLKQKKTLSQSTSATRKKSSTRKTSTKVERKVLLQERKRLLKATWSSSNDSED